MPTRFLQVRPPGKAFPLSATQLVVALALTNVLLAIAYLSRLVFPDSYLGHARLFDLDEEAALATWISSLELFLVGAVLCVVAMTTTTAKVPRAALLWLFAAGFIGLSMDETAQVHEAVGHYTDALLPNHDRTATVLRHTGLWMFVLGPPVAGACAWMFWQLRSFFTRAPGALRWFAWGVAVWLSGAVGLEALSNLTIDDPTWNVLEVAAEETCEMLGVTMMLRGALKLADAWCVAVLVRKPDPSAVMTAAERDLSLLETPVAAPPVLAGQKLAVERRRWIRTG